MFASILPTVEESARVLPGDDLIIDPTSVIDSAFDLPAMPTVVFPWFVQLGKRRAGWYLPRAAERLVPPSHRGSRAVEPQWQDLAVGTASPDYGGKDGYLECFLPEPPRVIGYTATRGHLTMTWVLTFEPVDDRTRVLIRLRMRTRRSSQSVLLRAGKVIDRLTIAGLAAGLGERLDAQER